MSTRDLGLLHPVVRDKCLKLKAACAEMGLPLGVSMTLRTPAEQIAFWAQGRRDIEDVNKLRAMAGLGAITQDQNRKITWVRISTHEVGLAFDI